MSFQLFQKLPTPHTCPPEVLTIRFPSPPTIVAVNPEAYHKYLLKTNTVQTFDLQVQQTGGRELILRGSLN